MLQDQRLRWFQQQALAQALQRLACTLLPLQHPAHLVQRHTQQGSVGNRVRRYRCANPTPLLHGLLDPAHAFQHLRQVQPRLHKTWQQPDRFQIGALCSGQIALRGQQRTEVEVADMCQIRRVVPKPCGVQLRRQCGLACLLQRTCQCEQCGEVQQALAGA